MTEASPQVCVIGLGYIGLPTAAVIANSGMSVIGVDVSEKVVDTINRGDVHIEEADLDALVHKVVTDASLRAAVMPVEADVFLIAVPTPFYDDGKHTPNVDLVLSAARSIAPCLRKGCLVILESTSPVGTTEMLRDEFEALRPDLAFPGKGNETADVSVAYCPERVLPGQIIAELSSNARSIGGLTARCAEHAIAFYRRFVKGDCTATEARTAEMVKLTENAFRDVNIAFANELSLVADKLGIDVWQVIELANKHPRVNILQPGPGVGGHCIAVDPWFIVHGAPDEARLIRTAREVNDAKRDHVLERARALMIDRADLSLACLGLAFKPNIDDFRESPALDIARSLAREFGARIKVVEPHADELPSDLASTGATLASIDHAFDRCGAVLLLVDHDEFKALPTTRLRGKAVYDTRGVWDGRLAGTTAF